MKSLALICLTICLSSTACLKTRAQLRDDNQSGGADEQRTPQQHESTPAQVQDVQPESRYAVDEIKAEITRMNGRLEDLERTPKVDPANSPTSDAMKAMEKRISELEKAQAEMIESLKAGQAQTIETTTADFFEKGQDQFKAKNYEGAIESMNTYLKNPKAKQNEEATFIRAESYYTLAQYKKAIVDYSKFPEKFTKSKRMPQALYKIGLSFDHLGMKEDAKGFYQELVEKFPKSPEGVKARAKAK